MLREMGGMITATDIAKFIIAGFLFVVTASWVTYTLLFILWIINYVIGLSASKNVDKIPYSWNKTKAAISELLAICLIIASVTMIGYFQRVSMDNVIKSCQTIAWVFSYLYVVNFLYNLVRLNPSSQIIKILYDIVSIEILS
jgi:uncharacterized membrane protein